MTQQGFIFDDQQFHDALPGKGIPLVSRICMSHESAVSRIVCSRIKDAAARGHSDEPGGDCAIQTLRKTG
jgi:hypothetical protein